MNKDEIFVVERARAHAILLDMKTQIDAASREVSRLLRIAERESLGQTSSPLQFPQVSVASRIYDVLYSELCWCCCEFGDTLLDALKRSQCAVVISVGRLVGVVEKWDDGQAFHLNLLMQVYERIPLTRESARAISNICLLHGKHGDDSCNCDRGLAKSDRDATLMKLLGSWETLFQIASRTADDRQARAITHEFHTEHEWGRDYLDRRINAYDSYKSVNRNVNEAKVVINRLITLHATPPVANNLALLLATSQHARQILATNNLFVKRENGLPSYYETCMWLPTTTETTEYEDSTLVPTTGCDFRMRWARIMIYAQQMLATTAMKHVLNRYETIVTAPHTECGDDDDCRENCTRRCWRQMWDDLRASLIIDTPEINKQ